MTPLAETPVAAPRSEQGAERRAKILAATVELLTRDGLGAVTHRAVAREAEVPLAATTYYFSSKDELLTEALRMLIASEVEMLVARSTELGKTIRSAPELAVALADAVTPADEDERRTLLAKFEVYLEAARRPRLRDPVAEWNATFVGLATEALRAAGAREPERTAPLMVAAIDGVLTLGLTRGVETHTAPDVRRDLVELVERLASSA